MRIEKLIIESENNLLVYLFQVVPPPTVASPVLRTRAAPGFWMGLNAVGEAPWPGSQPAGMRVRLGQLPDRGLFSVEDKPGLLLLAAFGFDGPGQPWEALTDTMGRIRQWVEAAMLRNAGHQGQELGPGVTVEWRDYGTPPTRGPWLALVPMLSLGAYPGDAEAILEQARTIGLDLMVLYGPTEFGEW
jgi:hypothetical protein